jgi:signal transduction histidine kinase
VSNGAIGGSTPLGTRAEPDAGVAQSAPPQAPRGRLFRKYVLFFIGLVAVALVVSGGFDFWFGYQENKAALIRVQQEKADAAAARIAEFINEIERQIGWTTHAQWSATPLDQRRFDYVRLLSQVPAITEISELDRDGKEQLKVSRLAMDVIGSGKDLSQTPAFTEARAHKVWFSPVYFRKESEPYMTLAIARAGRDAGVTVAEVNLKLIWDVITGMKIGQGGYAYVVDGRGKLIAHPDISLVLRDTDFLHLPQVAAALQPAPGISAAQAVSVANNTEGRSVLSAHAAIAPLGWLVFVEVPLSEAFAPLYGAALRSAVLLGLGLAGATLVALFLARRMTGPIREMQEGAVRLGAGDLDRRLDIHTGDELEALAQQFNRMAADLQTSYAELEHKVEERTAELSEALDQQTATAEVLGVINASPGDLAPVFDVMLEKASRLCDASCAIFWTHDGGQFRPVASFGLPPSVAAFLSERDVGAAWPSRSLDAIERGEPYVHSLDLEQLNNENTNILNRAVVDLAGAKTGLLIPLRKDGRLLGAIRLFRQEARAFTDQQIALALSFAAQAVIAIENARLITETREALDQQTATAEVLQVINSSPGYLTPVFDAMLDKAMRLCEAAFGILFVLDGELALVRAMRNVPPAFSDYLAREPPRAGPDTLVGRALLERAPFQAADILVDEPYRNRASLSVASAELAKVRTLLVVPLIKDDTALGVFTVYRTEVHPFTDKQIALLQNFAAQAVIAIENARLITETQEALEQQTATAEVLGVINASPGNLAPVFDAMLEKAVRLCNADSGHLALPDGDDYRTAAAFAMSPEMEALIRAQSYAPGRGTAVGRALLERHTVQIADIGADAEHAARDAAAKGLIRTILGVPLLRDGEPIGAFGLSRRRVEPFTDRQIELVRTFAAQAVIAMENARLITETQEALEQQTATAEVLGVINASPGDLAPVFEAMLEKAMRLCQASFGQLSIYDGTRFDTAATRGVPPAFAEYRRQNPPGYGPGTQPARLLDGERVIYTPDLKAEELYQRGDPNRRALVDLGGARTSLMVALIRDEHLLGFIHIYRQEVRAFTEKQIALLQNFAAQAVIAMENARLLDEIRQRQAELRVTFDNMGDGVVMFDAELRLAAWNKNFQQIVELPDAFLAEPHSFEEYIRYLATRGEFGDIDPDEEIARLSAQFGEHYSFNRTRPDGTVLEVRHNPMPEGGFVLIYSDITERKRSEAEIREARDAAEAALRELKTAQASLIQAEKMASLGQLTAGIAHEIKNPLNFVNNFASLSVDLLGELKEVAEPAIAALGEDKREELDEVVGLLTGNLEKIAEHGRRADNIVKSMLEHSRGVSGERRAVDLNAVVEEALNLAYHGARAQDPSFNITLERDFDHTLRPIELVPQDITRVFLNLVGNGFYAANKRAHAASGLNGDVAAFRPVLHVATRDAGDAVEVKIRDNGTGIPPAIRDKLFQPFFTTKPTGEGTGLGLSISYDIVTQQHGGTITVDSEEGAFTEFTIRLPRGPTARAST